MNTIDLKIDLVMKIKIKIKKRENSNIAKGKTIEDALMVGLNGL